MDTDRIRGGGSWSKDIEVRLNNCDVLIAVLTEGSFLSETCRAEQMWALSEGKQVIPVIATSEAPLPLHLTSLNYRRLPEQESDLLADLVAQPASVRSDVPQRYDTIPPLPQNFIPRETAVAELRDLLFTEGQERNVAVTAVAGMGGVGKTVLVSALCRDKAVQHAFPDGIAWITVGREWDGDVVALMQDVARALGEDVEHGWDTKPAGEKRYRNILRVKAALVVVDGVWNVELLKPLLVETPRSRFLFTTRDGGIARAITDCRYSTDLLDENDSRLLLARSAGKSVTELPPEAAQIIRACNGLAAAISQIGASLRGVSPLEWRDTLQALDKADISTIEGQLPSGQQSFFKSLEVSIQAIPAEMQERYLKLAVLLEDVPVPLAVLQPLWAVNDAEARRTARYFVDRSLATWESGKDPSRGIKLHDLQLDYVRARWIDRESLKLIHEAIRLSSHVIQNDPQQFTPQLTGRLLLYRDAPGIHKFLGEIGSGAAKPWLRPLHASLHPPGTELLRTLDGDSDWVYGIALTADARRGISASSDNTLKIWDLETGTHCGPWRATLRPFTV